MSGLCLSFGLTLTACDQPGAASQDNTSGKPAPSLSIDNLDGVFAYIKSIEIEAPPESSVPATPTGEAAAPPKKADWREGADILMRTGHEMTIGDGGLISVTPKFEIKLISAAEARDEARTRDDGRPALDVRPRTDESVAPVPVVASQTPLTGTELKPAAVSLVLPPEQTSKSAPKPVLQAPKPVVALPDGHLIQVGAFSTLEAAQKALKAIVATHPQLAVFKARTETVSTAAGQRVRLKLGPIGDQAEAEALCRALKVNDPWCARAG